MRFSLRQIEVFIATARFGTLSAAATSLSMSQSAASCALQDLETKYDTQLFDRVGKRLKINAHGTALLPVAESLIALAEDTESVLAQRALGGTIHVGATLTIGNYIAIPLITRFLQEFPDVDIKLHIANTTTIAEQVLNFELDLGFIEGEYTHDQLDIAPWFEDELVVFCAPSHPYATAQQVDDEMLLAQPWILREQGSGTRQTFDYAMRGINSQLKVAMELEHSEAIQQAVALGVGLGCLSKITLQEAFAASRLVPLNLVNRPMRRQLYRVLHKQKYRSRALQQWIEYIEETTQ